MFGKKLGIIILSALMIFVFSSSMKVYAYPWIFGSSSENVSSLRYELKSRLVYVPPYDNIGVIKANGLEIDYRNYNSEWSIPTTIGNYFLTSSRNHPEQLEITGLVLKIKNTSDQVRIIRWRESAITTNNCSGIPFLNGMYYKDAGSPSATPDTLLAPGQTITKSVYPPNISSYGVDRVIGEPIPLNGSVNILLLLKIVDAAGNGEFATMKWAVGVKGK